MINILSLDSTELILKLELESFQASIFDKPNNITAQKTSPISLTSTSSTMLWSIHTLPEMSNKGHN